MALSKCQCVNVKHMDFEHYKPRTKQNNQRPVRPQQHSEFTMGKESIHRQYFSERWNVSAFKVLEQSHSHLFVGLMVKASALRVSQFLLSTGRYFLVESHQSLKKLAFQWLPCQALGIKGSVLELVGLVSVYCDLMK